MTNNSLKSCKDYLKTSTNNVNLTIIDQIETPKMSLSYGNNLFFTSQWNLSKPFLIQKGYVPILRRSASSSRVIGSKNDSMSPDFLCLLKKNINNNQSSIFNISILKYLHTDNKIYTNSLINFVFNINSNQLILSNYSLNYSYNLFGSFPVNVFTLFGGNIFSTSKKFINVQRIQTYPPIQSIDINQFDLNCSLNDLKLDCILRVNLSNYANSFEQITIDYGDGLSFDSFRINPYCKYIDVSLKKN